MTDPTLFEGFEALPDPFAGLSADRRRTLRQHQMVEAGILLHPDQGISQAKGGGSGCSGFTIDGVEYYMQTTPKGIELHQQFGTPPTDVVTWTKAKEHAKTVPAHVLEAIDAARRACAQHQQEYPRFAASQDAQGCGPGVNIGPPTRGRALYEAEYEAWHHGVLTPYVQRGRALQAAQDAALDLAFPDLFDHEPTDLLECLEAIA